MPVKSALLFLKDLDMGLMTKIFGSDLFIPPQAGGAAPMEKAFRSDGGFSPDKPGKLAGLRSVPVLDQPRHFTPAEADRLEELARQKAAQAKAAKRGMKALAAVEAADAITHKAYYRGYAPVVASVEASKVGDKAAYLGHLQGLRPGYALAGANLSRSENRASEAVKAIAAGLR